MSTRRSRRAFLGLVAATAWGAANRRQALAATAESKASQGVTWLAHGLQFPEGPVALQDGSVLVAEIARRTVTRIPPGGGEAEVVADVGGGPNGLAIGPDGRAYVCNNGGSEFTVADDILLPSGASPDNRGGSIQRVDLATGDVETLYEAVDGRRLSAPNDLVFDRFGGFWFTDIGRSDANGRENGAVYYALADGSSIRRAVYPVDAPNGVALAPDGSVLFVAELFTGRLIAFDVTAPGELGNPGGFLPGRFVAAGPGRCLFDSMAMEADGGVSVAAPIPGVIMRFGPDGGLRQTVRLPGPLPTNLCFGGAGLRTAFVTLSGKGQLIAMDWEAPGLALAYTA